MHIKVFRRLITLNADRDLFDVLVVAPWTFAVETSEVVAACEMKHIWLGVLVVARKDLAVHASRPNVRGLGENMSDQELNMNWKGICLRTSGNFRLTEMKHRQAGPLVHVDGHLHATSLLTVSTPALRSYGSRQ